MCIIRKGNLIGDRSMLDQLPAAVFKVKSFDNSHSPAAQKALTDVCKVKGWIRESVYETANGRKYVDLIYPATEHGFRSTRVACFRHHAASIGADIAESE